MEDRAYLKNQRNRKTQEDLGLFQCGTVDPKSSERLKRIYEESQGI